MVFILIIAKCFVMDFKETINIIKIIFEFFVPLISIFTLIKGIFEYSKAQKWKKSEFLVKEIKEFNNDSDVQNAFLMLDWNNIDITTLNINVEETKKFYFNDHLFENSLKHHKEKTFTPEEAVIRLIMDAFLFKLGMFQNYLKSKLITANDLKPYIIYWIEIIGDTNNDRKSKSVRLQLWRYINYYQYDSVIELCKNYGFNIGTEKKPILTSYKNET